MRRGCSGLGVPGSVSANRDSYVHVDYCTRLRSTEKGPFQELLDRSSGIDSVSVAGFPQWLGVCVGAIPQLGVGVIPQSWGEAGR
jgi:hypothetical protein